MSVKCKDLISRIGAHGGRSDIQLWFSVLRKAGILFLVMQRNWNFAKLNVDINNITSNNINTITLL